MQLMADHKVSGFLSKKSYHALTLVSKYTVKVHCQSHVRCSECGSILLFQQRITVGYRCAKVWAMCLSPSTIWGYWHHAVTQQNISTKYHTGMSTNFKYSNPVDVSYILDGGALIHKISRVILWKVYWVFKKETWPNNVFFDGYQGGFSTKNNSHLRWKESSSSNLSYSQETT